MHHYSQPKPKTLFHVAAALFLLSTICIVVRGQDPVRPTPAPPVSSAESGSETVSQANQSRQQPALQSGGEETDPALATVASGTGLLVVLSVLMIGLLVTRRVRASSGSEMISRDGSVQRVGKLFERK